MGIAENIKAFRETYPDCGDVIAHSHTEYRLEFADIEVEIGWPRGDHVFPEMVRASESFVRSTMARERRCGEPVAAIAFVRTIHHHENF